MSIANITSRYHHLKQSNSIASLYIEEPGYYNDKLTCQLETFGRITLRIMGAQGITIPVPIYGVFVYLKTPI